jgi:hypothetical protein
MYGAGQARVGDGGRALRTLTASVEGGFTVPDGLRVHPWLRSLRGDGSLSPLVERAEAGRAAAARAYLDAGGPALLGV